MERKEIILMARDLMRKHSELDLWRFSFENYKKSFGRCNYTTRTISISSYLCDSMTNIAIKDTLIHEIKASENDASYSLDLLMIAKYLERIGDHSCNVARCTQYMLTGKLTGQE